MHTSYDHESRIDSALGKILRYFNLLELNLGLCIRHIENPGLVEQRHSWLAKSSIQEKINLFTRLVREKALAKDEQELDRWYNEVSSARCLRNYYVHGTWEYLPWRKEAPVGFRIAPWRSEQIRGSSLHTMTLEQLEADATAVQSVFETFARLRREYGV